MKQAVNVVIQKLVVSEVEDVKTTGGILASCVTQGQFIYRMKICNLCCITKLYISVCVGRSLYSVHVWLKFKYLIIVTVVSFLLYTQWDQVFMIVDYCTNCKVICTAKIYLGYIFKNLMSTIQNVRLWMMIIWTMVLEIWWHVVLHRVICVLEYSAATIFYLRDDGDNTYLWNIVSTPQGNVTL
jgi:hypothetical protein